VAHVAYFLPLGHGGDSHMSTGLEDSGISFYVFCTQWQPDANDSGKGTLP